jgi:hypothetical protein
MSYIFEKMRTVCGFLLCITLSFPAFSEILGLSYPYRVAGEYIAIEKKCGIEIEAILQKAMNCLNYFILNEKVDVTMQDEMVHELYRGMGSTPLSVTPEQCKKAQEHIQRYQAFCDVQ